MKARQGFVSNSSSSSFVIDRYYLSPYQTEQIKDHLEVSKTLDPPHPDDEWINSEHNAWTIHVDEGDIRGCTNMDNFDMYHFLDAINVTEKNITWRH